MVRDSSTTSATTRSDHRLSLAGAHLAVPAARVLSGALLLLVLLAIGAIAVAGRRTTPLSEVEEIRRRWSPLLVPVHPMAVPKGRPLVDVTEPATLVRLAERYGLLVLHWTRSGVETYVVQDDAVTYRYRTSAAAGGDRGPDRSDGDHPVEAAETS